MGVVVAELVLVLVHGLDQHLELVLVLDQHLGLVWMCHQMVFVLVHGLDQHLGLVLVCRDLVQSVFMLEEDRYHKSVFLLAHLLPLVV
jgi:hypothetical protein